MTTSAFRPDARPKRKPEAPPAMNKGVRACDCRHYDTCLTGAALADMATMPCGGCKRYQRDGKTNLKDVMAYIQIAAHILEVDTSAFYNRQLS